jgi:hypothetical protein
MQLLVPLAPLLERLDGKAEDVEPQQDESQLENHPGFSLLSVLHSRCVLVETYEGKRS